MGEWSEYFEDFPEENPANWVNGRFDPAGAAAANAEMARRMVVVQESAALQKKMHQMAVDAKRAARERESAKTGVEQANIASKP